MAGIYLLILYHQIIFMRAFTSGIGLIIRFSRKDKPVLESGGIIETNLSDYPSQKAIIHVVDKVTKREFLNEPGIRTMAYPKNVEPEKREYYETWMEKKVAKRLIEEDYLVTRCPYDRLEMTYWDI